MDGGTIALEGRADELLRDPQVAALYLGGRVNPRGVVPGVSQSALAKPGPSAALTRNEAG